ncbi:type II restriction endonuclease [Spectribacter hydrogenooxidans]|uniref:Type II restriction endonuclease n=1 Tax=Spectribacter hydrogenoxidans TaxID=3075608 RepID=A0ABU3BVK3_9GAMM|nr:type II restriction endonuclease [Salinisphaera sp. W335]MDT0633330.1 type II restriction endonuclease [Salinisphaera sp. W335]
MHKLDQSFLGVMAKQLSAVEANRASSNQHEFNGTTLMKRHLGLARRELDARFIYIGRKEDEQLTVDAQVTWYDARENDPNRTEHRLYFHDNPIMDQAGEGDVLIMALRHDASLVLLIVDRQSEQMSDVLWLFGIPGHDLQGSLGDIYPEDVDQASEALFNHIAEELGLGFAPAAGDQWLDLLLDRFGPHFPTTRELSALALETLQGDIDAVTDPDSAIIALIDREEALFRQLERHIVIRHLAEHAAEWQEDVDAFVSYSLGIHNRRKSRAGHALENHIEWLLLENTIRFDRGATTEGRSKPDFLFPGESEYHDPHFEPARLSMLGVKTTCKDRWRQVLNEAARIPDKHLLTLQPGISSHQTDEMRDARLSLVVPQSLHANYETSRSDWLLSVDQFIHVVRDREP